MIGYRVATSLVAAVVAVFATAGCRGGESSARKPGVSTPAPPTTGAPAKRLISFDEAQPIIEAFPDNVPSALRNIAIGDRDQAWRTAAATRDAEIRARLLAGDEDSIVNLWMFGTSFTKHPRVSTAVLERMRNRDDIENLLLDRLDDLVAGIAAPGANERLRFAREVVERQHIDPSTPDGQQPTRLYLVQLRARALAETKAFRDASQSGRKADSDTALHQYASLYQRRGLSSDTSVAANYSLDRAIAALAAGRHLAADSVHRVAIVGPGLDFVDKIEGFDFYPVQTIQPFALIDSLARHGLSDPRSMQVTTFDLSPRVNQHLDAARARAARGDAYVLQLPLTSDVSWLPDVEQYWRSLGDRLGADAPSQAVPPGVDSVRVRATAIRADVVRAIVPRDLNIILERVEGTAAGFDVIVATNVLVYYDPFEQALALANIAAMLRPGGFFVTNYLVSPRAPLEAPARLITPVFWDHQRNGDTMFAYRKSD